MNWKTYLKKKGARVGAIVVAVVLVLALIAGALGGKAGFLTNLDGIVRAPLQKAATVTAQWLESIYGYIYKYDQLKAENDQLRVQLAEAQAQAREGQEALAENERYRELLGFTQRHTDFELEPANVVSYGASNWSSTLTLSKGSDSGIEVGDCVMNESGALVGQVIETGSTWATVRTVIDVDMSVGGYVSGSGATAMVLGDFTLMQQGCVRFGYLAEGMTWYETGADKIAVVRGGKFVGKTWAVADFAMGFFEDHIIIDMDKYPDFAAYAAKERRPEKLHAKLTTSLDKYDFKDKLLIFDNAQNCVGLLGNLVEYSRYNTDCRICVIATSCGPIPGEEECQDDICVYEMMPMNFEEFLKAGKGRKLCAFIENQKITPMPDEVRDSVQTMLETFFVTGGMPEAVDEYYKTGDLRRVDVVLKSILDRTTEYLINSTPKRYLTKVMAIWNSIPVQLTKENKKFMYGYVDPKARAREYEASVDQIVRMGVVRQVYRVRNGVLPLANQKDDKSFELYHLDHGLLRVMAGILVQDIDTDNVLDMMDGVIAEQYALAELYVNRSIGDLYFWISSATAKVDFVYEGDGEVIPVDVQTSPHTKAQSSRVFKQRYDNQTSVRISTDDMFVDKGLVNIPLYGIWCF